MDGLIDAFSISSDGAARSLTELSIQAVEGCWNWLHLDCSAPSVHEWIRHESGLDAATADALLEEETRPRHLAVGDGSVVIVRGVNQRASDAHELVALRFYISPSLVVALRHNDSSALASLAERYQGSHGPRSPELFFDAVLDTLTDGIAATIDNLEDQLDELEEKAANEEFDELRSDVLCLRRKAVPLKRFLAPQREALKSLSVTDAPFVSAECRAFLAETADRTIGLVESLDAVRERAALLQEEVVGEMSERVNRNTYVLSIIASVFLPLSFLTGLLGVNVGGLPGMESPWGFWIVVCLCLGLSLVGLFGLKRLRLL